jgi:hypothetical protein
MSKFVDFGSRWICLAGRSHSSFALVVSCVCGGEDLLLVLVMPIRAVSERSRPMRVGFPTGTLRCRSSNEGHSSLG